MSEGNVVQRIVKTAADQANITAEQSLKCVQAALKSIQEMTEIHGYVDLSEFGLPCVSTQLSSTSSTSNSYH